MGPTMGPRLSLGGRASVDYLSAFLPTRMVSVFMSDWFCFFVDLRCVALRSESLFAPFIGVNALSTSSFGLTCLLVTCVIKHVRIFLNRYPGS